MLVSRPEAAFIERHIDEASDAHYAVLFSPPPKREAVAAVFAFYRAMRELLHVQPDVAPTKVTWWHEELARLRQGQGVHPLSKKLAGQTSDVLFDAMDALLHGAVMDLNQVDVTDDTLNQYLRLRGGALHEALGAVVGDPAVPENTAWLGRLTSIPSILSEARDPRFADRPNGRLTLDGGDNNDSLEKHLCALHDQASLEATNKARPGIASAVYLALGQLAWPGIISTPYGAVPPPPAPWRKLWTAWRAARNYHNQGTAT